MLTELARQYQATAQPGDSPRTRYMSLLDAYYHGCQYDFLPRSWDETLDTVTDRPIPFRSRRPSTVLPFPRVIVDVFVRALWGAGRRAKATLAGGEPEDNALLDDVIDEARVYRAMSQATSRALRIGTGLVVWRLAGGRFCTDVWDAKYAEPTFKLGAVPELEALEYRFTYKREVRDPQTGHIKPTTFWHRERIDAQTWIIYADVEMTAGLEPTWTESSTVTHALGFVPAVWFTLGERGEHEFDGTGIYAPYLGLVDEANYTASQLGRALYYNLDPQTVIAGVSEGELEGLYKGGRNTWCLPKDAKAELLESNGSYVAQALERLDLIKKAIYEGAGVVLPDPERVKGAQSGASLELLAAPQIAQVDAFREEVGEAFCRLLEQMIAAIAAPQLAADRARIEVRERHPEAKLADDRIVLSWGSHFPRTPRDAQIASDAANRVVSAGIVSRRAAAHYVAPHFGVEDVEADQELVDENEAKQDKRIANYDAAARFAGGHDDLPPHLENETSGGDENEPPDNQGT